MKKRKLRPSIEKVLCIILFIQIAFFCSLQGFAMEQVPFLLGFAVATLLNLCVLKKYGRGIIQ